MELAKTDYQNETELSAAREMIERRDTELARLREELSQSKEDAAAQRTLNTDLKLQLRLAQLEKRVYFADRNC